MANIPVVSVCMITYNHEAYIKQAIEGVLLQQTNFQIELIIVDDYSTDQTETVIKELINSHPDSSCINYIRHHKNLGMIPNFIFALKKCNGIYIGLCEGDDYWTDPLKLQKQVDFLEANPDYSISFHNVKIYNQEINTYQKDTITRGVYETTGEEDLAKGNYIHTPSVVLRNDFEIPLWFNKVSLGDWSLYMLSIKGRKIFKFEEEMGVYRIHNQNMWAKNPKIDRVNKTIENIRIVYNNVSLSETSKSLLEKQIQSSLGQFGVSVCIPTYNGARYLFETLQSIQSQTYQNIEVIVSDDASEDNTLKMVEAFKDQVDFPVHIYHHTPSGIGANWNNCLKQATGKYIKFLFQDDVMVKECLEKMVQVLEENPKVGLVASKRDFIIEDEMNTEEIQQWVTTYGDLQNHLNLPAGEISILDTSMFGLHSFYVSPSNKIGEPSVVMFRKTLIDEVGYFNEELKQILDYEYWYRILKNHPIAIINEPLVKFRLHQNQATNINRKQNVDEKNIYEQILYRQYYKLLHSKVKNRLDLKYNPLAKLKNIIKKLFN